MKISTILEKSVDCFNCGDIVGAIAAVERFLKSKPRRTWTAKYARAYLYQGSFFRFKGNYSEALRIQEELSEAEGCNLHIRGHALVEQAIIHRHERRYTEAKQSLAKVAQWFDTDLPSGLDPKHDKLMQFYFATHGMLSSHLGQAADALDQHRRALDHLLELPSTTSRTKALITSYLNMYDAHMALGNSKQAMEYMILAHAKMKSLDSPYAYGLIQLLENLAAHNLFVAGSQSEAINALNRISEKVVNNFGDFRKVFDFFSSIIVQLHDRKFDLERIRNSIREYGDDPLIKAYLPVLLTGAPPPGNQGPDDDVPAARLAD